MHPPIETREAAIEWLQSQGLYAAPRDWSFGKSIIGASGRQALLHDDGQPVRLEFRGEDVVVYSRMLCIYPENEGWSIARLTGDMPMTQCFPSLDEAILEATSILLATEAT